MWARACAWRRSGAALALEQVPPERCSAPAPGCTARCACPPGCARAAAAAAPATPFKHANQAPHSVQPPAASTGASACLRQEDGEGVGGIVGGEGAGAGGEAGFRPILEAVPGGTPAAGQRGTVRLAVCRSAQRARAGSGRPAPTGAAAQRGRPEARAQHTVNSAAAHAPCSRALTLRSPSWGTRPRPGRRPSSPRTWRGRPPHPRWSPPQPAPATGRGWRPRASQRRSSPPTRACCWPAGQGGA